MSRRLIIDGNSVYEIDEECKMQEEQRSARKTRNFAPVKKQEKKRK